jgi:sugar phosphate isomerase/epimerase
MTRRGALAAMAGAMTRAAGKLPANKNMKWALSLNLWNHFQPVQFTDILDVMRDTGFIGIRVTQFQGFLEKYQLTIPRIEKEMSKRGLYIATISYNGPVQDASQHKKAVADAREAMSFLKNFGANRLVVFSPSRTAPGAGTEAGWKAMCQGFNRIGEAAGEMGFQAGLHNHLDQMCESQAEVDRSMAETDPKLFGFSPDTAHLHLAGCDVVRTLERHKSRLVLLDYKDAKWTAPTEDYRQDNGKVHAKDSKSAKFFLSIYDLGDGEIDFPACQHILKGIGYKGWNCVDLDTARKGPRHSYERCGKYIVAKLEPIYV